MLELDDEDAGGVRDWQRQENDARASPVIDEDAESNPAPKRFDTFASLLSSQ